jgi:hypothetical protein
MSINVGTADLSVKMRYIDGYIYNDYQQSMENA